MSREKNVHKAVRWWVNFRTSLVYVWVFMLFVSTWILVNKTGLLPFDNDELTYLNLILSVMTELQSIVLLVYTMKISERI